MVADETFFVLTFNRDAYNSAQESGAEIGDEGVEEAFEIEAEISERFVAERSFFAVYELTLLLLSVKTHKWIGDCFIYTNTANRLNYLVGTETQTVTHFDKYVFLR